MSGVQHTILIEKSTNKSVISIDNAKMSNSNTVDSLNFGMLRQQFVLQKRDSLSTSANTYTYYYHSNNWPSYLNRLG